MRDLIAHARTTLALKRKIGPRNAGDDYSDIVYLFAAMRCDRDSGIQTGRLFAVEWRNPSSKVPLHT
jgi:hypothetical protein